MEESYRTSVRMARTRRSILGQAGVLEISTGFGARGQRRKALIGILDWRLKTRISTGAVLHID